MKSGSKGAETKLRCRHVIHSMGKLVAEAARATEQSGGVSEMQDNDGAGVSGSFL